MSIRLDRIRQAQSLIREQGWLGIMMQTIARMACWQQALPGRDPGDFYGADRHDW